MVDVDWPMKQLSMHIQKLCNSPVENQIDLELDFKVFFFVDSSC